MEETPFNDLSSLAQFGKVRKQRWIEVSIEVEITNRDIQFSSQ